MKNILVLVVIASLAWIGYGKFKSSAAPGPTAAATVKTAYTSAPPTETPDETSSAFNCDGRTMCSQMTSCGEATFFIQHCPNTRMDGNNDGVPCERQWCN
jgi:hypothetical protein